MNNFVTASEASVLPLFIFLFGYLLGSVPFGLLLTRFAGLGDVRAIGSGNIGATNVLRTGRKDIAALTLIFDTLKATAAILFVTYVFPITAQTLTPQAAMMISGFGAFCGHLYPVWLRFKGGKGVATFLGVTVGFSFLTAFVFAASWLLTAYFSRYSSLAALVGSLVTAVCALLFIDFRFGIFLGLLFVLLVVKHRANIDRLLIGQESRIGAKNE